MKKFANYLYIEKQNDHYTLFMTPELQDDVGTVGYAEFTDGDTLEKEDVILNLEASKTVMSLFTPLAGRVIERNTAILETPTLLNSEKPTEHWILTLTDVNEADFLALEDA